MSFSNTTVAGLKLWLDAAVGVTQSGGIASLWADQSGNGNDLVAAGTPTFVASAINGLPGVNFSTPNAVLARATSPLMVGSDRTVFVIAKPTTSTGVFGVGGTLVQFKTGAGSVWTSYAADFSGTVYGWSNDISSDSIASPPTILNTPLSFEFATQVGSLPAFAINGTTYAATGGINITTDNGADSFSVGNNSDSPTDQFFAGDICEVIVYDRILSGADLTAVRAYINAKYFGGSPLAISPTSVSLAPLGTQTFTGSDGTAPYTYAISINNSGGSINGTTGVYTAGSTPSVTDTITVTDSALATADAVANVGVGVSLSPSTASLAPSGAQTFTASGGSGTGYVYSIATNNSGGTINASTGHYVAGTTGSVTDTVRATDSLGNTGDAIVTVGAGVSVTPSSASLAPHQGQNFVASGGSGTGYVYSFVANNSGGTINASTGHYAAGGTGSVTDTIRATDSLGNVSAGVNIAIGAVISISPTSVSKPPHGTQTFSTAGGTGTGIAYTIFHNNSGGTINASTGHYTAGTNGSVVDTVRVQDSTGSHADALVTVTASLSISPSTIDLLPGGANTFTATGGSGSGNTFSFVDNNSGGTINASTGAYTAGPTDGIDTVQVTDDLSNTATATIIVSTPSSLKITDTLGHGAVNQEQIDILRGFLNPALKGRGWDSMISALAVADQRNADNARLAFDQLFLSTASGAYLDRRASDEGINRPKGVNMSDDLFRQLALTQRNGKLTQKALLDVLEIFYGRDTTRASSETSSHEPYALQDGDELVILFEERNTITVTFEDSSFTHISQATAEEVAATITRACRDAGNQGFAVSVADPISGLNKVRIYSGTLGLTSSIRIVGGRGNLSLLFPTPLFVATGPSPFATWDITFSPNTLGNLRFTMTAGTEYNLFQVQTGDLVYIYGSEFADSANGTYEIKNIFVTDSVKWFEIDNPLGVESAGVVQTLFKDLAFFRPKRRTIYDNTRRVVVCENDGYLDVIIPATTEVVGRGPGLAAYLNEVTPIPTDNPDLTRVDGTVYVDTGAPHGLEVGDQIFIDGAYPDGTLPVIVPATPSGDFPSADSTAAGTTASSVITTMTETHTYQGVFSKAVRTQDGRLMIVGGATTPDGTTFTPLERVTMLEKVSQIGGAVDFLWTQISSTDGSHGFSGNNFGYRNFAASVLMDGRVLCTGGSVGDDETGVAVAGYDLFTFIPSLAVSQQSEALGIARAAHAQVSSTVTNIAIICGGWVVNGVPLATTEVWSGTTDTWSASANMNIARMHHEMVAVGALDYIAIGGMTNLDGSTWVDSSDGVATDLPGNGLTSAPGTLNRCETYNAFTETWTMTGSMTYARAKFSTVTIPDGRVIVFGGKGYLPQECVTAPKFMPYDLNSVEIYDPTTRLWSNLPSMQQARVNPVCTYMPSTNEIWVTSGANDKRTEVLDVSTMRWRVSAMAQITTAHENATGGLLGDDVFAMIGGVALTATGKFNYIIVPGDDKIWYAAGINSQHRVDEVIDSTHFTVITPDHAHGYTKAVPYPTFTPSKALSAPATVPGPFSYDPKTGFAITATAGTTDTVFNKGVRYSSIHLTGFDPALAFPDEAGWLVFNFGYANAVGPIRYLGRLSDSDLILDASVPFSASLPAGASVRLLAGRTPYEPAADRLVGNFYVTGTAAGREAARNIIDDIIAAGKQVLVTIVYPGDHGLGAEGFPQGGNYKLSDKVSVWGGDNLDSEIPAARKGP